MPNSITLDRKILILILGIFVALFVFITSFIAGIEQTKGNATTSGVSTSSMPISMPSNGFVISTFIHAFTKK